MKRKLIYLTLAVALLAVSVKYFPYHCNCNFGTTELVSPSTITESTREVKLGSNSIKADLANTPALREKGLSGRAELGKDEGMLFVFDKPGYYGFWMKDMNFPIDIVWINENKEVVDLSERLSPDTYPDIFYPHEEVKYVLELPAGYIEAHNISIGDKFSL
jgi:uncharacterized membrane protein (UPF0127 family)